MINTLLALILSLLGWGLGPSSDVSCEDCVDLPEGSQITDPR